MEGEDGRTLIEVGGLDRAEARTGLDEDVAAVVAVMDAGVMMDDGATPSSERDE